MGESVRTQESGLNGALSGGKGNWFGHLIFVQEEESEVSLLLKKPVGRGAFGHFSGWCSGLFMPMLSGLGFVLFHHSQGVDAFERSFL